MDKGFESGRSAKQIWATLADQFKQLSPPMKVLAVAGLAWVVAAPVIAFTFYPAAALGVLGTVAVGFGLEALGDTVMNWKTKPAGEKRLYDEQAAGKAKNSALFGLSLGRCFNRQRSGARNDEAHQNTRQAKLKPDSPKF